MTAMTTDQGEKLIAAADSGVPADFIRQVAEFRDALKNPEHGAQLVNWISTPVNLTAVHTALTTKMGIVPRALAIRRLNVSRGQKVMMLLQAMEAVVTRTHKL